MGPTQPHTQWVLMALSPQVKCPQKYEDHHTSIWWQSLKISGVISPHSQMPSGHVQTQLYFTVNMHKDTTSHSHYVASTTKFQASTSVDTIQILHWYTHRIQYLLSFSTHQSLLGNFCSSTTPNPYKCFSYLQKNTNSFQGTQTRKLISGKGMHIYGNRWSYFNTLFRIHTTDALILYGLSGFQKS